MFSGGQRDGLAVKTALAEDLRPAPRAQLAYVSMTVTLPKVFNTLFWTQWAPE